MAAKEYRKGTVPYGFVPLPKDVLRDPEFIALPASSKVLLLDLAVQFTGKNNGRLCPSFEVMKRSGWTSKQKLVRARRALLECRFAIQTRIGHPPRTAEWIGFTWWKLDWHESMEVSPRAWPYLNFVPALSVVPKRNPQTPKQALGGPDSGPMSTDLKPLTVPIQHHATEVKAEKSIGPETGDVLDVAISAPVPIAPVPLPESLSGPPQLGSLLDQLTRRIAACNSVDGPGGTAELQAGLPHDPTQSFP